jgi:hypothetical protein
MRLVRAIVARRSVQELKFERIQRVEGSQDPE